MALLLLLVLFLVSCDCTGSAPSDYSPKNLTDNDRALVNYSEGDSITFVHSTGLTFSLAVDSVVTERTERPRCSLPDPDEEVETQYTYLSSTYPSFDIMIRIVPQESEIHQSVITINRYTFYLSKWHYYTPETPDTIDITLNSQLFTDVLHFEKSSGDSSDIVTINELLYSPEFGILQIGKSNGETYTIDD